MKVTKIAVLLLILISTTSCMFNGFGIRGNGNVETENRKITSSFNAIKVSQGINLYLSQGSDIDLSVEADENILDLLVTEVEGDVLKIYFDKNVSRATRNVYLTAAKINSIRTTSGASVKSEGMIKTKSISLDSSSGSDMKLNINAQDIECSTSSGADIYLTGTTVSFEGDASSGSNIDADKLKAETSIVEVSSGASINVYASKEITAQASSGGDIDYYGNPTIVNKSKSSGGSVSKN